jgi:nucleotide-binding universal stress UspA family protein
MAANKQIILMQTILAGVATFAMLALFHTAQPDDTKTVGAAGSMRLVDRATDLPNLVGAGGLATDGDDDEAQLQQQLQAQQQMQQAEQQAEEQEQLANQEAQQAEQQGLQVEQQATLSVPGS